MKERMNLHFIEMFNPHKKQYPDLANLQNYAHQKKRYYTFKQFFINCNTNCSNAPLQKFY